MGLPRYENIDQLPNIAMAVRTQIQYIVQRTVLPIPDEEAITELQEIIEYLMYLLGIYQQQLLPQGDDYIVIQYVFVDTVSPFTPW